MYLKWCSTIYPCFLFGKWSFQNMERGYVPCSMMVRSRSSPRHWPLYASPLALSLRVAAGFCPKLSARLSTRPSRMETKTGGERGDDATQDKDDDDSTRMRGWIWSVDRMEGKTHLELHSFLEQWVREYLISTTRGTDGEIPMDTHTDSYNVFLDPDSNTNSVGCVRRYEWISTLYLFNLNIQIQIRYNTLNIRTQIQTDLNFYKQIQVE
jgi:hypothetical protein